MDNALLREIKRPVGYSSDECDLITEFYEPAMSAAVQYDRAVGYFSSSSLALISKGIQNLYLRNGKMRLIASPVMSEQDREAIRLGHKRREELFEERLLDYLDPKRLSSDEQYRMQLLSGMISDGLLEVQIAVKEDPDGSLHMYHEKVGVFIDKSGDYMTFIGSPNESWNGWVGNVESFALHKSWSTESAYAAREKSLFDRTWCGKREGVPVYDIPSALKKALFERFPPCVPDKLHRSNLVSAPKSHDKPVGFPDWLADGQKLRDYQKEAVNEWLSSQGRGIFAMATGTGKTITALAAAAQLTKIHSKSKQSLLVVVVVPSKDLVTQWYENARDFYFAPICCHSGMAQYWPGQVRAVLDGMAGAGGFSVEMIITTGGTMVTDRFQKLLKRYHGNMLVIGDEMHSFGTKRRLDSLPDAQYRLGLSATPHRHGDEEGTAELLEYFGEIKQSIDIKHAIELGALVPYTYMPILVQLDDLEMEQYKALSAQIAAMISSIPDFDEFIKKAGKLLTERTRLLGHAQAKVPALKKIITPLADTPYNLVYVAEGTHPIYGTRQLDEVVDLLGAQLGMRINTYTSETPSDKRASYQNMLRDKSLQALVAMRCLDEGIDIPEAKRGIILASTQNPRQFVQRRGRILRRDDKGGKTHAELYDMLVVPKEAPPKDDPTFASERRLVGRELSRALELASASENGRDAPPKALVEIMIRYELLELLADYNNPIGWHEGDSHVYG